MVEENVTIIDTIDDYNKLMGLETLHPLVAVVDVSQANPVAASAERTWNYGVYSLWLKQAYCGDLTLRLPRGYRDQFRSRAGGAFQARARL